MPGISGIIRDMAIGAGLTAPLGAGALYMKNLIDPPTVMSFPETSVDLPLISDVGPEAPKKETAAPERDIHALLNPAETEVGKKVKGFISSKDKDKGKEKKSNVATPSALTFAHLLGGLAGVGLGYKGLESYVDNRRAAELDKVLQQRRKALTDMLLSEQHLSKNASMLVLDEPVAPLINSMREAYAGMNPIARAVFGLGALSSLGYGAVNAYRRATRSDENRAMRKALKRSIEERLGANVAGEGKGSIRGPMVVKIHGERLGVNPIKPGASALVDPSSGRDVFSY